MKCPGCGAEIPNSAVVCPACHGSLLAMRRQMPAQPPASAAPGASAKTSASAARGTAAQTSASNKKKPAPPSSYYPGSGTAAYVERLRAASNARESAAAREFGTARAAGNVSAAAYIPPQPKKEPNPLYVEVTARHTRPFVIEKFDAIKTHLECYETIFEKTVLGILSLILGYLMMFVTPMFAFHYATSAYQRFLVQYSPQSLATDPAGVDRWKKIQRRAKLFKWIGMPACIISAIHLLLRIVLVITLVILGFKVMSQK